MVTKRQFGVSTSLYQGRRLVREYLLEIAAHGFTSVELVASRTHFDFHNVSSVGDLQQWLGEAGLELPFVSVPADEDAEAALLIARRLPVRVLIVRAGALRETARLIEHLSAIAAPLGVTIAVDSSSMVPAGSLVHFIEEGVEASGIGACLDFGASQVAGDLIDDIETVSGHLVATHVHDSRGRKDERLVPFDGAIDWASAMTAIQKIGYDGPLLFDVAAHGSTRETLKKIARARERLERLLDL